MNFDYVNEVEEHVSRLTSKEQMLGKGLNIPFNATNSGSRKIMNITHQSHTLVLSRGEVAYVETGYENRYGDRSSSIMKMEDRSYQVIAKISKFSDAPNHDYYLILADCYSNMLHVVHRISYKYKTEIYGYLYNNSVLDSLSIPGTVIEKDTIVRTSTGFDEYMNKTNGTNLNVMYCSTDNNMEDSVIISDKCSEYKMAAPIIHKVRKIINENDIPLNIHGDSDHYKAFPNIGEETTFLCAFRREDKDDAIYTQSVSRLQQTMMSDEKITVSGVVIDIDVFCNNIQNLESNMYNTQFKNYFNERQRTCAEVVRVVSPFVSQGYQLTYDLQKFYFQCKEELSGKEFMDKRKYSNMIVDFYVMEMKALGIGDKVADRFGGKGVISKIVPQNLMPQLPNGQYADMIKNSSTMNNRENPGQLFEISINYVSMCILDAIRENKLDAEQAYGMILKFLHIIDPVEEQKMQEFVEKIKPDDFIFFISSIVDEVCIYVSNEPISDEMNIDIIGKLYDAFPFIKPVQAYVPIRNSNGQYRKVLTRKPIIIAKQYIIRLKQLAEEKFSATSLSSTNIKSENAKSKASKSYKEPFSNAPIRFGYMETGDFLHMGGDVVIINLMMYSLSPHGRRLIEEMYVGDPYDVDIKLNSKARNRSVEQLNAKLKTMGYRMIFNKTLKKYTPLVSIPLVEFEEQPGQPLISFVGDDYDINHWYETVDSTKNVLKDSLIQVNLVSFEG